MKEFYPKVNLRIAFKSPAQLGNHFPFKDKVSDPSKQALVVYHVKCNNCESDYIGKSSRILSKRIDEHMSDPNSHVYQHEKETGHNMDFDNIKILDRASNDLKLQYKEMLYIRKLNPSLNRQMNSELFSLIIRNVKQDDSITKDIQKYLKKASNGKNTKKCRQIN